MLFLKSHKNHSFLLIAILVFSCRIKQDKPIPAVKAKQIDTIPNMMSKNNRDDTVVLDEYFVDSNHIGRNKHNKVEVSRFRVQDDDYLTINFYAKSPEK